MKIKSIKDYKNKKKLAGKKALLRVDFNVPINKGRVEDDYKIVVSLPAIRFLLRYQCKVIIITHLGRPLRSKKLEVRSKKIGDLEKQYSVKPIAGHLEKLLGKKIKFVDECVGFKVGNEVSNMKESDILMLGNLRFYKEEKENNKKFAKQLASLADIYVNNAFAVSHRKHASLCAIKNYLPSFAGLLLEEEIKSLNKILHPRKPSVAVIGGVKVATKLPLLQKIFQKQDYILIGGAMANNFLRALGYEAGKSLIGKEDAKLTKQLSVFFKKIGAKKILLPVDVVVSDKPDSAGRVLAKGVSQINKDECILDIGPKTIKLYSKFIKKANTIVWNGPMGKFESEHFRHGTLAIARVIAARSTGRAFGVAGGGETVEALKMAKMFDYMDWVSTGGGAMLTYLSGGEMPGLEK